ncbi:MAG: hypothetical protein PHT19_05825 [Methylococcus sp.]|nr:hypothetical protein [Methylococcus sp.]
MSIQIQNFVFAFAALALFATLALIGLAFAAGAVTMFLIDRPDKDH